jgi:hypothetical protein
MLLVQHPRYGDHSVTLESEVGTLVVELHTGGTLQGRVHWGGTIPTRPYMLILEYRGARGFLEVFHFPRFSLTDLAGEFRLGNLSPGKYSAELSERFLHQDPVGLIAGEFRPTTLHREELEIVNGETTELVIDLSPTGRGATARIVGRVRVDGQVIEGALVKVRGNESLAVKTDSWGRFETPDFAVRDSARVTIEGEVPLADGRTRKMQLHHEVVFLKHNDVHEIDLDLYPLTLRVQVLDVAFDEPVAAALVSARGRGKGADRSFRDGTSSTDAAGEATLLLLEPGEYVLSASAPGFGKKTHVVEVPAGGLGEPKVLKLIRSVPCAGHVALDATLAEAPLGFSYIQVHGDDGVGVGARLEAPEYKFDLEGLAPGTYRTWIFMHGQQGHGSLSLGPDGERDLVLEFVPSED